MHLEKLREKAEESGLAIDELLTLILKSYFEWDKIVSDLGFILVQEETLQAFLNYIPETDIKRLATQAADRFTDRLLVVDDKIDLDYFLLTIKIRLEKSGFSYNESKSVDHGMQLKINHGLGYKWSIYFANNTARIVTNLGHAAKTTILEDSWTISIRKYDL
jgi:hypothetical protein